MIIYLFGISCVGKTTIARLLAKKMNYSYFDVDEEIQKFYEKPIERIQDECFSMNEFREKGSVTLDFIFSLNENSVVAGTPSGLKYAYYRVYKKHAKKKKLISIHLMDKPEKILNRLTFYDKDSNPIYVEMDELKKKKYLKAIKADYNYFKDSYMRADIQLDISNLQLNEIPEVIIMKLNEILNPTINS